MRSITPPSSFSDLVEIFPQLVFFSSTARRRRSICSWHFLTLLFNVTFKLPLIFLYLFSIVSPLIAFDSTTPEFRSSRNNCTFSLSYDIGTPFSRGEKIPIFGIFAYFPNNKLSSGRCPARKEKIYLCVLQNFLALTSLLPCMEESFEYFSNRTCAIYFPILGE